MSENNVNLTLADLAVSANAKPLNELLRGSLNSTPLASTPVNVSIDASKLTSEELSRVLSAQLEKGGLGLGLLNLTPSQIQSASGVPYLKDTLEAIFKKNGVECRNADGSFRTLNDMLTDMVKDVGEPALYRLIPKPILEILGGAAIAFDLAATGGQTVKQLGLSVKVFESADPNNRHINFNVALKTSSVGSMPVAVAVGASIATANAPDAGNLARSQNPVDPFKPTVGMWAIASAEVEVNNAMGARFTVITGLDSVRVTLSADTAKNEYSGAIAIGSGLSLTGNLGKNSAIGASYSANNDLSVGLAVTRGGAEVKVSAAF